MDLAYIVLLHRLAMDLQVVFLRTIQVYLAEIKARPERKKKG